MPTVNKPAWWSKLSSFYGFSNDGATTIDSGQMLVTLDDYVEGLMAQINSAAFVATMGSVLQPTVSKQSESGLLISNNNNAELILGFGGVDYLAGTTQDNIQQGGQGHDYFGASAGVDLIIGSDETQGIHEKDTIAYLLATSGIVVNATVDTSSVAPDIFPHQDIYSFTYADWVDPAAPKVVGFQSGAGGDVIDVSILLAHVGYTGSDPVADGFIRFSQATDGLKVQFDPDGFAGSTSGKEFVRLVGQSLATFSTTHNLKITPSAPLAGEPYHLTFVANDGFGAYDILYSVENIIGSKFGDTIHGHTIQNNILSGAAGNDFLYGEGGADILIGGTGTDTVDGGTGNDLLIIGQGSDQAYGGTGIDSFKFDGSLSSGITGNTSTIWDFTTGAGGDKVDVSEILLAAGYTGSNAVADGYVQIVQNGLDTNISIDMDGSAGAAAAQHLAILKNVTPAQFSTVNNLVTAAPKILYVGILGQSNAEGLRVFGDDAESGISRIQSGVLAQTNYNSVAIDYRDELGSVYVPAIGSTRVNGDYGGKNSDSWWYPATNKPGEILIRAVEMLTVQIAEARASGAVKPVIVWGQGEGDCVFIGGQTTETARLNAQNVYMNATLAVFDYIKAHVGSDIQFYIMETGRYSTQGGLNSGVSQATIDRTQAGLPYIRAAQEQMALDRPDIFVATKYTDLPLNFEYDPIGGSQDAWHFHPETREIIGDRVADYIALSQGFDHILDNPGDYPIYMLTDLTLKSHAGMIINGNANNNIVVGTLGNDTMTGGAGTDTLYGGAGTDTAVYTMTYANYTVVQGTYLTVAALSGTEGTDTLMAIERVEFADGVYENGVFTPYFVPNNPPIARDDVFSGEQDQNISGNLISDNGNGADSDQDNDPLNVVAGVFATANGSVSLNSDGSFVYTPNAGFYGIDSFDYTLEDGEGGSDVGTVFLTVNEPPPPNNAPIAQDDVFTGEQDTQITGNVLANNGNGLDSDPDSDPITVAAGTFSTENGSVTINADGSFVYTPNAGFYGIDGFNYTVMDNREGSDIGAVTLTINQFVNVPPVAQDDAFTGNQDQAINGNVLADNGNGADSDANGHALSVVAGTYATAHGNVTVNANGTFTYTPNAGYTGADTFDYTVEDGFGGSDIGTVNLTVNPFTNNPPVAQDDVFSGNENVQITGNLLANNGNGVDSDLDGNPLNVVAGTYATANGSVTVSSNGDFVYTPNAYYYGADGFDYTLQDGQGGSDTGAVSLTLNVTGIVGTEVNNSLTGTTGNDIMRGLGGNDTLSGELGDDVMFGGDGNDTLKGRDGNDTMYGGANDDYLEGGNGDDIFNGGLGIDTMKGGSGKDTFIFTSILDAGDTIQDFNKTVGEKLDLTGVLQNVSGFQPSQAFTGGYIQLEQSGLNTLVYVDLDGTAGAGARTLLVTLQNVTATGITLDQFILPTVPVTNDPPVAQDDSFSGQQDQAINGNVLLNNGNGVDSDPDGHALNVVAGTFATANGNVTVNANGTFTYTPNAGYFGADTFNYTLQDGHGGSDVGTVNLTVNQFVNTPPVAQDDAFVGEQDQAINGNVLADNGSGADSDVDGHTLNVVAGTYGTANGSVTVNADGTFTYTPNAGYFGADTFDYTVQDGFGGSDTGTVNLTINQFVNTPPVAQDDAFVGEQDQAINGNVLADNGSGADSDANGHSLSVVAGTYGTANGSVTVNADGTFTYTPNAGYFGADTFNYTVEDGFGGSDTGTVNLTINQFVNVAPVAQDDAFTGPQDQAINGNVLADNGNGADSDANNHTLTVLAGVYGTAHGSVTVNTDGSFVYTPNAGYFGADTFDYTVEDGFGGSDIGTVNLTINSTANNPPIAQDDVFSGNENVQITGNLLANNGNGVDSDLDGNPLNVVAGTYATANGSVTVSSNGDFVYTPNAYYYGADGFDYTLQDGQGGSDTGAVSLTLNLTGIVGTEVNNSLTGTTGNDIMRGLGGNDFLSGELGEDVMFGGDGNDTLKGRDGNDIMYGGANDDYLEGGNGDDTLYGGLGIDTMKGSSGADSFIFTSMLDAGDIIQDYNYSAIEKIDISAILELYDPLVHLITDFVQITTVGANSVLAVDADGGANNFVTLATILNVVNLTDEQALVNSGHLVV